MREPIRWRDDPSIGGELRELLGQVPNARPLDPTTRRRMARRLSRTLAIPLVLTSWLTLKTAAASLAITAGAVTLGAVAVHEIRVVRELSTPIVPTRPLAGHSARPTVANAVSPVASLAQAPALPRSEAPTSTARFADIEEPLPVGVASVPPNGKPHAAPGAVAVAAPSQLAAPNALAARNTRSGPMALATPTPELRAVSGNDGALPSGAHGDATPTSRANRDDLTTEARLLELARRALIGSPGDALALVEEHRTSFPRATLGLERELIRVEALSRLGRKREALSLAQTLRQHGGLYTERIDRLIKNIENAGE